MRVGPIEFTGQSYLLNFVLPNFFFHVTTAYDILRQRRRPASSTTWAGATSTRDARPGKARPATVRTRSHCAAAPPAAQAGRSAFRSARRSRAVHASRNVVRLA